MNVNYSRAQKNYTYVHAYTHYILLIYFYSWSDTVSKRQCVTKVAFQIRIQPATYDVGPETIGSRFQIDPKFPNSQLEWSTKRRGVTVLVGLLVQVSGVGIDGGADTGRARGFGNLEPALTQVNFHD